MVVLESQESDVAGPEVVEGLAGEGATYQKGITEHFYIIICALLTAT